MAKRGALVALLGLGGGKAASPAEPEDGARYSKGEEPEAEEGGDAFSAASDSLLSALNVPADKRGQARDALKQAIRACMSSGHKDADDSEE